MDENELQPGDRVVIRQRGTVEQIVDRRSSRGGRLVEVRLDDLGPPPRDNAEIVFVPISTIVKLNH